MRIVWSEEAWEEYLHCQRHEPNLCEKINGLLRDIRRSPHRGLGKPEPLRHELAGWWSRRIDDRHRLIYRVIGAGHEQRIEIAQCRSHYRK